VTGGALAVHRFAAIRARRWWFAATVCLLLLTLAACAEDKTRRDDEAGYADLVAAGERHLQSNEGELAAQSFWEAANLDPAPAAAPYGHLLASPMRFTNLIDQVIDTINGLTLKFSDNVLTDPIHEYLDEKLRDIVARSEDFYADLAARPDAGLSLDGYALQVAGTTLLDLSGEFGATELRAVGGLNALVSGLLHLVYALDLHFDPTVLHWPKDMGGDVFATIDIVAGLLDALLSSEDYPTFLMLVESTGAADMQTAGVALGDAFARIVEAFDVLGDGPPRDGAPISYLDLAGNGVYDPYNDPVCLGDVVLAPELAAAVRALCVAAAAAFYEGSPLDANPDEVDGLTPADLNELLWALDVLPLALGPVTLDALPAWPVLDVGTFFSHPTPDGLRSLLGALVEFWENPGDFLRPDEE
jgi:hypothetical protein